MAAESRYGRAVRERTKLIAALLRTPDEELPAFAESNDVAADLDVSRLMQVRDLADKLGTALQCTPGDPCWQQLEAAWSLLCVGGHGAIRAAPPALGQPMVPEPPVAFRQPIALAQPGAAAQPATLAQPVMAGQPSAGQLVLAGQPSAEQPEQTAAERDFRHDLMFGVPEAPNPSPDASGAGLPDAWKPQANHVPKPEPGQEQTAAFQALPICDSSLAAVEAALNWHIARIAQLSAALLGQRERGTPGLDEICRWFDLPDEEALYLAIEMWQRRFDTNAQLAKEHADLVNQMRQNAEEFLA